MTKNGFDIGHFGFFKDPEMTMRLDEDNLYDQIDANGWIDVWFGGQDIWIPDFGVYNCHLTCDTTFFWDILDENGERTKQGFDEIIIPYNEAMKPYTGDIIPLNPEQVFNNYSPLTAAKESTPLLCSNLWFYTNYFGDEYFRYNLLILKIGDQPWPNEISVDIRPMNDNLVLEKDEYIVGYRPKPEYMNQLAIVNRISSGMENKIWFRFKADLDYLSNNPNAKRSIKLFIQDNDKVKYLLYPRKAADIIWRQHGRKFMNEYQRYLLENGVMQYMPDSEILGWGNRIYDKFMKSSNYVLKTDGANFIEVATDINAILNGDTERKLVGYSALIIPDFLTWLKENQKQDVVEEIETILYRVILTKKYFKGFQQLDDYIGDPANSLFSTVHLNIPKIWDGETTIADGNTQIVWGGDNPPVVSQPTADVNIVMIDGVRQFEDGYVPTNALGYLFPKDDDHHYNGATGNGLYKIRIAERAVDIFCDMTTDEGGWMYLITSERTTLDYLNQIGDASALAPTFYSDEAYGVGWGKNDGNYVSFQTYNIPFSRVRAKISGAYDNPTEGTGYLDFITSSSGHMVKFYDSSSDAADGQSLIVDGNILLSNSQQNLTKYDIDFTSGSGDINSLVIKMKGDNAKPYSKRYVYMLAAR